jgi:hypothetical protein
LPQNINIILSLVNLSEKKLQYNSVSNLDEVNKLFQNNTITFNTTENKDVLSYNPSNLLISLIE